jgi:pimeloyl-ACP methyl ester carboxylesterase
MPDPILCPQVGQDLTEAKVVALHVKVGDTVKHGQIVAEVESEKATFDVESFSSGIVIEIPYQVGENATVLEPLVVLGGSDAKPVAAKKSTAAKPANGKVEEQHEVISLARTSALVPGRSSPLARRMASSNGLDISRLTGTGPHGAIVLRDIESTLAKSGKQPALTKLSHGLNLKSLKDGKGTPVVFIHGFGAEISAWRQIAMAISLPNTLLAIDLPGHGASSEVAGGFQAMVEAVADTLRSAGHEFHLVGHSLGAAVATALTGERGLKIKSLTLFAPAGLGPSIDASFVAGYLGTKSEAALGVQMRRLVNDPAKLPASIVKATQAAREANPIVVQQARVAAALFEGSTQLFSVQRELGSFAGPVRVVLGQNDSVIPSSETERTIPAHAALHRIANTGHLPFLEEQSLSARLIAEAVRSAE